MRILNKIEALQQEPFILTIGSIGNVGKTSLSVLLIKELLEEEKTILVLSDDTKEDWLNKLYNIDSPNISLIDFHQMSDNKTLKELINHRYDILIIDTHFFDSTLKTNELINFIKSKRISAIITKSLNNLLYNDIISSNTNLVRSSDFILYMHKIFNNKPSYFKKIIDSIFNIKRMNNNIILHLIKNRHGKETKLNIFIDFEKINTFTKK